MVSKYYLATKASQNVMSLSLNKFTMPRKIHINKHQGNTVYSVHVEDSFNQQHHIGYEHTINNDILAKIEQQACDIWANEVKQEVDSMSLAIAECVKLDEERGKEPLLD